MTSAWLAIRLANEKAHFCWGAEPVELGGTRLVYAIIEVSKNQ
jgi:hypothetical protein